MATYKAIQGYVKSTYGFVPKTCWITPMKELCGLPVESAPNRNSASKRKVPCPPEKIGSIKAAFVHFKMI